jgi:choline-sulfatase
MTTSRPNFLFFFPDELRAESLGCYGHPVAQTPNLDEFARQGVQFEQCHVQNTVCSPSRCSLMTGLYPHVSGHRTLWHLLRPHEPSLFGYLKEAGYQIKWFGKNHLYADEALKDLLGDDAYRSPDEMKREMMGDFRKTNPYAEDDPRFYSFLMEPERGDQGLTETQIHVQRAIDFLQSEEAKEAPFVLFLPTLLPHAPYVAPEPFYSMYTPDALPPLKPVVHQDKPSYHELIRAYRHLDALSDDTLKQIQAVYLGMTSHVDAAFGELIQGLEANGFSDNTTVIVSSDHGDYAGDYGLVEKWPNGMEDCLTRVPLLIRSPGCQAGHVVREQVELFDIMATMLDLAGVEARHDHFAQSLVPQLRGASGDRDRAVFADGGYDLRERHCFEGDPVRDAWFANNRQSIYWPKARQQQEHPASVCRTTMMRTLDYKLIRRTNDISELYDLTVDPLELRNVYQDDRYEKIRADLERRLLDWFLHTSDTVPRDSDAGVFVSR